MAVYVSTPFNARAVRHEPKVREPELRRNVVQFGRRLRRPEETRSREPSAPWERRLRVAVTKTSMATVGGTRLALMKTADSKAYLAQYNTATYPWTKCTSFTATSRIKSEKSRVYTNNETGVGCPSFTQMIPTARRRSSKPTTESDGPPWADVDRHSPVQHQRGDRRPRRHLRPPSSTSRAAS
jgi:hypothetical protein